MGNGSPNTQGAAQQVEQFAQAGNPLGALGAGFSAFGPSIGSPNSSTPSTSTPIMPGNTSAPVMGLPNTSNPIMGTPTSNSSMGTPTIGNSSPNNTSGTPNTGMAGFGMLGQLSGQLGTQNNQPQSNPSTMLGTAPQFSQFNNQFMPSWFSQYASQPTPFLSQWAGAFE